MTKRHHGLQTITPNLRRRALWRDQSRTPRAPAVGAIQTHEEPSMLETHAEVEEIIDLREEVRLIIDANRALTQAVVAREVGISATTFSQWLAGNYPGDNAKVEAKILAWLVSFRARQSSSGLPAAPEWIETPSSERALAGLRYAQLANDMVVIYGGAGTGKTKAIERYQRMAPNVSVVTMTPASYGVPGALQEIAIGMNLRDYPHSSAALCRLIVGRLRGTNGLVIIDEAQHLGVQALDQIRGIHDLARVGIALVGNEQVYSRMTGGTRAAYLDRLFSRIGKRIYLRRATEGDIDAVITGWGIGDRDCRKQIHDIATKPGALRVLTKVLRLASSYAQAEARGLCCDDVRAAWKELGGLE